MCQCAAHVSLSDSLWFVSQVAMVEKGERRGSRREFGERLEEDMSVGESTISVHVDVTCMTYACTCTYLKCTTLS